MMLGCCWGLLHVCRAVDRTRIVGGGGANYVVRNYFEEIDKLIVSPRLRQKAAFAVL